MGSSDAFDLRILIAVGHVATSAPPDTNSTRRSSVLAIQHVLVGQTQIDSLGFDWFSYEHYRPSLDMHTIHSGGGPSPEFSDHHGRVGLWTMKWNRGSWTRHGMPIWVDELDVHEIDQLVVSLDLAPRDYWYNYLDPDEIIEEEMPVLAVRNYLMTLRRRSNKGLQLTNPLVTPLVPSAAPRPLRGRVAAEPQRR